MIEKPIIMQPEMARATFLGDKTNTRRDTDLEIINEQPDEFFYHGLENGVARFSTNGGNTMHHIRCRYGKSGGKLFVRENIQFARSYDETKPSLIPKLKSTRRWYPADGVNPFAKAFGVVRPSIYMPKYFSRSILDVLDIRVERLQDISEADALAEGICRYDNGTFGLDDPAACMGSKAVIAYMRLWNSINGAGSWDKNPWVWSIHYRKMEIK